MYKSLLLSSLHKEIFLAFFYTFLKLFKISPVKERRDTWKVKRAKRYFRAKNIDNGLRRRTQLTRIEGNTKDQLNFKRTIPARHNV